MAPRYIFVGGCLAAVLATAYLTGPIPAWVTVPLGLGLAKLVRRERA